MVRKSDHIWPLGGGRSFAVFTTEYSPVSFLTPMVLTRSIAGQCCSAYMEPSRYSRTSEIRIQRARKLLEGYSWDSIEGIKTNMHIPFRLTSGTLGSLAATVVLATFAAGPALAGDVTFAQYVQTTGAEQWAVSTTGTTTTATAAGSVFFLFQNVSGLPFAGPELATFSLTATSTTLGNCATDCSNADGFTQTGYSGSFSFIDAGSDPGADLLSGVFQVVGTGPSSVP
jgi:hypothetical protein